MQNHIFLNNCVSENAILQNYVSLLRIIIYWVKSNNKNDSAIIRQSSIKKKQFRNNLSETTKIDVLIYSLRFVVMKGKLQLLSFVDAILCFSFIL